jgi:hypothetical protein
VVPKKVEDVMKNQCVARSGSIGKVVIVLFASAVLPACETEPELEDVPQVSEVAVEPMGEVTTPQGTARVGEVELKGLMPLDSEDVGKVAMVTGQVVGQPVPQGFFVETEGSEVLFVRTPTPPTVTAGQTVRAVGTLGMVNTAEFQGWHENSLENEIEAEWKIQERWYIDGQSVTPM